MNEMRELGGIPEEEDRSIVCHHVPVSFLGSELDGEATRVASTVMGARLTTNGGKADTHGAFLALFAENVG